jgi:hypothetical protein
MMGFTVGQLRVDAGGLLRRVWRFWIPDGLHIWWGNRGVHVFWSSHPHFEADRYEETRP